MSVKQKRMDKLDKAKEEIEQLKSKKETTMKQEQEQKQALLVTTLHKGVFFGYTLNSEGETIKLTDARMCLYWAKNVGGFMGLASHGPTKECRISARASSIRLTNITSVCTVDAEAVQRWEKAPCVE